MREVKKLPVQIIRADDVMEMTGLPKTSIKRGMKEGTFPKSIKLGERASGWVLSEIQAWIDARIAERDAGQEA